eukprot:COSAG03_NODE_426_length_8006_cov_75.576957_3_plen_301_part_00
MLLNIVEPMLKASPALPLRLLTVSGSVPWNQAWAEAVGDHVFATSFHEGYMSQPRTFSQNAVTACAKRPRGDFMDAVRSLRSSLDATNKTIAISADEWGLGPPWRVQTFSVAHGMYAAGFLGAVTRGARENNLQMTNYFEPVNEGAIQVLPFNSTLTPVGEVMRLFSHHTGGTLLAVPDAAINGSLDTTATASADGKTLVVTLANLNAVGWAGCNVTMTVHGESTALSPLPLIFSYKSEQSSCGAGWSASSGSVSTLKAQGFGEQDMFESHTAAAPPLAEGGVAHVYVPPFSVAQVTYSQ